ncbi:MAG: helix-hairpin-helix domain-containing protein [Candidatus Omnitrophota bacterium]|jgi:comEA protein
MFDSFEKYERIILSVLILALIAGTAVIIHRKTRPALNIEITSFAVEKNSLDTVQRKPAQHRVVNINTASPEELVSLKGIGPSLSERIVAHRNANGPFRSKDGIKDVKGIGETLYSNIKDVITTE